MGYWVKLSDKGIPVAFSGAWFEGSQFMPDVDDETLITCRWDGGAWVPRDPEPVAEPEPEPKDDDAAERAILIDQEVARIAAPDVLLRSMGKITIAELTARVAAIRAQVEARV